MQPVRRSASLSLLALVALAGCGGTTKTVTVGGPPAGLPAASSAKTTTRSSATTGTTAPSEVLRLATFRTPTGNISCAIRESFARCDIEHRSWSPPARPASCSKEVDYGQGIEMQASGAPGFVCAGDTVASPGSPALAYGEATRVGAFECLSAATGLTCRRTADAHGFFLSIQSYRIF